MSGLCKGRERRRIPIYRQALRLALAAACLFPVRALVSRSGSSVLPALQAALDLPLVPVCKLQGRGFSSPLTDEPVRTRGVVFGAASGTSHRGVFIQTPGCDDDPESSDGLFVFLGEQPGPAPGDLVEVSGVVQEYFGRTELDAASGELLVLSRGNPLPAAVRFDPPPEESAAGRYFEAREGMRVELEEALVSGPTDASGKTWIRPGGSGEARIFQDSPAGTGQVFALEASGAGWLQWGAKVGDRLTGLTGALDYRAGMYLLLLLSPADLSAGELPPPALPPGPPGLSAASLNLSDLFDTLDDPAREDTVLATAEYRRRLEKRARLIGHRLGNPDLIAVQEVENQAALEALLSRPEIGADYGYILEDGPDLRGLDVAVLYRKDRLRVLGYATYQGCTALVDGLGPDGNGDARNPQNALTCDRNQDGERDGNRLFSRPPLVVHLALAGTDLSLQQGSELWVIANHWKSKTEDTPLAEYTAARRLEQAQFVAGLAAALPPATSLLVLGDLNDLPGSSPLAVLQAAGLQDSWARLPPEDRYSYIYRGLSQALDYILFRPSLQLRFAAFRPVHINADYPHVYAGVADTDYRCSDHDPLFARFRSPAHRLFLPVLGR